VRAEYFFLVVLHYSFLQEYQRVEQEEQEFSRYIFILGVLQAEYFFLVVLHYSFLQDYQRVEQEELEFSRCIFILWILQAYLYTCTVPNINKWFKNVLQYVSYEMEIV